MQINNPSAAAAVWGGITGTLADQTDLNAALTGKRAIVAGNSQVYTTSAAGAQNNVTYSSANGADTISVRDANGHIGVAGLTTTSRNVTSTGAIGTSDAGLLRCNATTAAIVLTLPAANVTTGYVFTFKKTDVSANSVTVQGAGADTIDGGTVVLAAQYDFVSVQSTGTAWFVISK